MDTARLEAEQTDAVCESRHAASGKPTLSKDANVVLDLLVAYGYAGSCIAMLTGSIARLLHLSCDGRASADVKPGYRAMQYALHANDENMMTVPITTRACTCAGCDMATVFHSITRA